MPVTSATIQQAPPKPGKQIVYDDMVARLDDPKRYLLDKLKERYQFGYDKYHQPLMTFDGRDTSTETEQEALDLMFYAWKGYMETGRTVYLYIFGWARRTVEMLELDAKIEDIANGY